MNAGLIWPEFALVDGMVLMVERVDAESPEAWRAQLGKQKAAIE